MKRNLAITAALFALVGAASAQNTATTDPVGFVSVTVPAQSDAVLAVPLNRSAAFKGKIQTISGNVITVAGTPAWTANQFVQAIPTQNDTFAIQIATGSKEGLIAKVTANTVDTLTVQFDAGDDLSGVKSVDIDGILNADEIDVMPYWTPSTLIASPPNGSELFAFSLPGSNGPIGTNLSPSSLMVYDAGSGAWLDQISEESVAHVALKFGSAFGFRNNSGAGFVYSCVGSVPMSKYRALLATLAGNTDQDIRIGYASPVPELLSAVNFPAASGDQIFAYDNAAVGKNKSPSQILVYDGASWLDSTTEEPVPTFTFQPGFGYVFRKFRTSNASVAVWSDLQSYLAP
ncbi:MAG: TIGR02597 family protein [Verrucomicrobiales bacterium]|nr:TIGR02597 family protein [Verrucomicrobiales bacterium]MCP5557547.1 TIGR02597 family protein [Verrucomicrobiaceae bacterium]